MDSNAKTSEVQVEAQVEVEGVSQGLIVIGVHIGCIVKPGERPIAGEPGGAAWMVALRECSRVDQVCIRARCNTCIGTTHADDFVRGDHRSREELDGLLRVYVFGCTPDAHTAYERGEAMAEVHEQTWLVQWA